MHKLLHRICAVMLSGSMLACGVPVSALPAAEAEQSSSSLKEVQTKEKENSQEKDEDAEISVQGQDPDHTESTRENEDDTGNDTASAVETREQEEDDRISLYAAPSDKVVGITKFESSFVSGADEKDNGDLVWNALSSAKGHAFKWRLDYAFSVQGSVPENDIGIHVPAHVLKNQDGEYADQIRIALPERNELDSTITDSSGFAYYMEDSDGDGEEDEAVIYNYMALAEAPQGYVEIAYETTEPSYNYMDYGAGNDASDPFQASCNASGLTAETESSVVYIDTQAYVTSTSVGTPLTPMAWQNSWGAKPSDADQYLYMPWEVKTSVYGNTTQKYYFRIQDSASCEEAPVEVVGVLFQENQKYILGNMSEGIWYSDPDNKSTRLTLNAGGTRKDFVLTRYKKADFSTLTSYNIANYATVTVEPADGADESTTAKADRPYGWTSPVFEKPQGHFYIHKYGNENWTGLNGYSAPQWQWASYGLQKFQEGSGKNNTLENLKYAIWEDGYAFPWTLKDGGTSDDPYSYGYKPVTYTVQDDTLYPLEIGSSYFTSGTYDPDSDDAKNNTPLSPDDYDFDYISIEPDYQDTPRNASGNIIGGDSTDDNAASAYGFFTNLNRFNVQPRTAQDTDVVTLYTKSGNGSYVKAGTINFGSGKITIEASGGIESISQEKSVWQEDYKWRVDFKPGVDGWKYETSNNYYHTNLYTMVHVRIFDTERTKAWTGSGNSIYDTKDPGTAKDAVLLKNVTEGTASDASGKQIWSLQQIIGDRIRRSDRSSEIRKSIASASNDVKSKQYTITWQVRAAETLRSGSDNTESYSIQNGGVFYDLLPQGSTFRNGSVKVSVPTDFSQDTANSAKDEKKDLEESDYEVSTIDNFRKSDRTMLIVKVKTEAPYYVVSYDTVYTWEAISDYGRNLLNPAAYETGNTDIADGYPDNGGVTYDADGNVTGTELSEQNQKWYSGLDPDSDGNRFIYSEAAYDVTAVTSATAGLNKRVMSQNDDTWTYDTIVGPGEAYRYRLRFMNSYSSSAKNIILYDSIENYFTTDGAEKGESDWHGALQYIDTSQPKYKGIAPQVYISAVKDLDLDDASNRDITNQKIWTKKSDSADLSKVTAVAIDMRKMNSGLDYTLPAGESIVVSLYMKAPVSGVSGKDGNYPETWNNVYITDTQIGMDGVENDKYMHQDYTTVRYQVSSSFSLHKYSSARPAESVRGVQFSLTGTSDYGTKVNMSAVTDKNGLLTFKKIEMGTYVLQETSAPDDWIADSTKHTVKVTGNAEVYIDGQLYTGQNADGTAVSKTFEVANSPRVHTDISFTKKKYPASGSRTSLPVEGVKFRLSGTSDYGNDVLLYAVSAADGTVEFKNVEKGTFELSEVSVPDGYVKDTGKHKVRIDSDGNASIESAETQKDGSLVIYNDVYHSFRLIKRSAADQHALQGAVFTLSGVSLYGTSVSMTKTSSSSGFVSFTDIEPGTYVLQETAAPKGFVLDNTVRKVVIGHDGSVQIDGLTKNENGNFEVQNQESSDKLIITKKWVGNHPEFNETNLPTIHISSTAPEQKDGSATLKSNGTNGILALVSGSPVSFGPYKGADSGALTTSSLPASAVKIDDGTTSKSVYAWDSSGSGDIVWWSDAETVYLPVNSSCLFIDKAGKLTSLNLAGLDSSKTTNMSRMFASDASKHSLAVLDISGLDTSKVTDMSAMFQNQSAMQYLDIRGMDTSSVTDMSSMFGSCSSLKGLDLSGFNTSNVTNMSAMFFGTGVQGISLDFSSFDTSKITTMSQMFSGCHAENLDLSAFRYDSVISMARMFEQCRDLQTLDLGANRTTALRGTLADMFANCTKLTTLNISALQTDNVEDMSEMFYSDSALQSVDVSSFNTKNVTSMRSMFAYCSGLKTLNVSNFDVSRVTNAGDMFYRDAALEMLDVSGFHWDSATSFPSGIFSGTGSDSGCLAIYADDWSMKISYSSGIFYGTSAVKIQARNMKLNTSDSPVILYYNSTVADLDISGLYTTAGSLSNMLYGLSNQNLVIKMDGFSAPNATNAGYMMYNVSAKKLDLSKVSIPNALNFGSMFANGQEEEIDLSGWDTSKVQNMGSMFSSCSKLKKIYVSDKWSTKSLQTAQYYMFDGCTSLSGFNSGKVDASMATVSNGYLTLKQTAKTAVYSMQNGIAVQAAETITHSGTTGQNNSISWKIDSTGLLTVYPTDGNVGYMWSVTSSNKGNTTGSTNINVTNAPWGDYWSEITAIKVTKTIRPYAGSLQCMFAGLSKAETIDLTGLDTSSCKYMTGVLTGCAGAKTVTLPNSFISSATTSMSALFQGCHSLTSISTKGWDTSNVTDMSLVFSDCWALNSLDVSGWNTSKVTTLSYTFCQCRVLKTIDVSGWDTSNVTTFFATFSGCNNVTELNVSSWNTSKAKNMKYFFASCYALTSVDVSRFDTSNVTDMGAVFSGCHALKTADVSAWDTSKATDMNAMFSQCRALQSLDLKKWNTSSVTNMYAMFSECSVIKVLDLSSWNTAKVTNMSIMFGNCKALEELKIDSFDTSSVTNMDYMFNGDAALKNVNTDVLTGNKVTSCKWMFQNCSSLQTIDLGNFNPSGAPADGMFNGAKALQTLDIHSMDTEKSSMANMFAGTKALENLTLGTKFAFKTGCALQSPAADGYSGKWTLADPYNHQDAFTADGLIAAYNGAGTTPSGEPFAGTWVWEKSGSDPALSASFVTKNNVYIPEDHTTATTDKDGNKVISVKPGETADELFPDGYWQKISDDTWVYTSSVHDEGSTWYIWEDSYTGYRSDHTVLDPDVIQPGDDLASVITNTSTKQAVKTGSITLNKKVVSENGTAVSDTNTFMFTVTLTDKFGKSLSGSVLYGTVPFTDGTAKIALKSGDTVTMENIPEGYHYSIAEDNTAGYTAKMTNQEGTVTADTTAAVQCTNTKKQQQAKTVSVSIEKTVTGHYTTLPAFSFHASLTGLAASAEYKLSDGTAFRSDGSGEADVSFTLKKDGTVQILNIPVGATYTITEEGGNYTPSYTVSDASAKGKIRKDKDSTLKNAPLSTAKETADDGEQIHIVFTNRVEKTQNIILSKKAVDQNGKKLDSREAFTIHIEMSGLDAETAIRSDAGVFQADENGMIQTDFNIYADDSVTIYDVPVGTKYKATEKANSMTASYTVSDAAKAGTIASSSGKNIQTDKDLSTAEETVDENENVTICYTNTGKRTAGLIVKKTDAVTGAALGGASFDLYKETGDVFITHIDIEISGISKTIGGLEAGTYYLVETKAPAGHTVSGDPVRFEIKEDMLDKTVTVTVSDGQLVAFPVTGGSGRKAVWAGTGILAAAAYIMIAEKKRKSRIH